MGKKILLFSLLALIIVCFPISVQASEGNELQIEPYTLFTKRIDADLTIESNGIASIYVKASGYEDLTTKVVLFVHLQQYQNGYWNTIDSWYQTTTDISNVFQKSISVVKGYSYRIKVSCYTYSGSEYENLLEYSNVVKY